MLNESSPSLLSLGVLVLSLVLADSAVDRPQAGQDGLRGEAVQHPKTLEAENERFQVALQQRTECCPATVELRVTDKRHGGLEKPLFFSGRIQAIHGLTVVGGHRVLLQGELPTGGNLLVIGDLETLEQEEAIPAYGFSVSPSARFLVYATRYPPAVAGEARRSIYLLYDLSRPPDANRVGEPSEWPVPNAGRPVFPEANVEKQSWSIFEAPRNVLQSPFLWSPDEQLLVFLASEGTDPYKPATCYAVRIRLDGDGRVLSIRKHQLDQETVDLSGRTVSLEKLLEKPLCFGALEIRWPEDGTFDKLIATVDPAFQLGHRVEIQLP